MAITNDSGVRTTGAVDLADMPEHDHQLVAARRSGIQRGLRGVDVPVNQPEHDEPHVAPLWIMYGTFAALLGLTVLTVAARFVEAGSLNIWIALGLAFIKSLLVAAFFMHLWWDTKLNQLILVSTLLFLTIFIGILIMDTDQYQEALELPSAYTGSADSEATQ
jgi:cytochrome c oxidase subunit 4